MSMQRRADTKSPKTPWGQMRSLISRISALCHLGPRSSKTRQNGECDVAIITTAHCSSTPRPSLSTTAVPSSQGCESLSISHTAPEAPTALTPERCLESSTLVPRVSSSTSHPRGASASGLIPTMTQATPPLSKANLLTNVTLEPTSTGISRASSVTLDDFIPDLTGLVQRGRVTYRGQYSDVYQGIYGQHLVAIKVIKSLPCDLLPAVRRRMRREVGTASRFDHPNVLAVFGVIEADWCVLGGIVTPWCRNGDAGTYLRSQPVISSRRLLMVCGVAAGLEYIHGLSVVHGDLKPGNILIDASGNPLICDFGLVCVLDADQPDRAADNTTTVHNGTVRYLAYELVKDPPESRTMASDIHALGCVAYEFLYLERPYSARSGNSAELYIFRDIAAGVPPAHRPPPPLPSSVTSLWYLLEQCWDKEPDQRPNVSAFSSSFGPLAESDLQLHL